MSAHSSSGSAADRDAVAPRWVRYRALRIAALVAFVAGLIVLVIVLPLPSVADLRHLSVSLGPWFPIAFFAVHVVATVAPFPRTVFTVSAGVLFGSALGVGITLAATTVSAVLAFLLVRTLGRDLVSSWLSRPGLAAVEARLARRGWLAVGSLRLIGPVPFSLVNYLAGVSAVRLVPFTVATAIGIIPGTVGVVVLGDALTGHTDTALLVISALCIAFGVMGLVIDARLPPTPEPSRQVRMLDTQ